MKCIPVILLMTICMNVVAVAQDLCTIAIESTFKFQGEGSIGTCFIVGQPVPGEKSAARYVLVTARHVLNEAKGEKATIHLRKKNGEVYKRYPFEIAIRTNNTPLWVEHPIADVAAMYVALPRDAYIRLISTDLFATDDMLAQFEIRPGDQLFALGYPLSQESNAAGFPVLRSGTIASYPLLPTKHTGTFLLDFEIYKGNSGGPVLLVSQNRVYAGGTHVGVVNFIIGLVSGERVLQERVEMLFEKREQTHTLKIAQVVHASMIKETIDILQNK